MSRSIERYFRRGALALALSFAFAMTLACVPAGAQQAAAKTTSAMPTEKPGGKGFASPEAAAAALYAVAKKNDEDMLLVILGPSSKEMVQWDTPEERRERRQEFAQRYDQMHRLVKEQDGTVCLYVGAENWPLPFPLVQYKGQWYFDFDLGRQEIMYRRIGRNELEALEVCHALVDAEKEYYGSAHQYTAKFVSTSGKHDGLFWKAEGSMQSPIGPYLAHAGVTGPGEKPSEAYHGYYYRIVTDQGASGFSVVAFPAEYRMSGVMTFVMNANGEAFEKDLGDSTAQAAAQITSFNPDSSWKKAE